MKNNRRYICSAGKGCRVLNTSTSKREITFYPVVFDNLDSWGRMYSPTSFNRTIKNNNFTFPHLVEHMSNEVVGKTIRMEPDDIGLLTVVKVSNTTKGDDLLTLYNDGIYKYHSFAGYIIQSEWRQSEGKDIEYVTELALDETTTTLFPANRNAALVSLNGSLLSGINHKHPNEEEVKELIDFINDFKI